MNSIDYKTLNQDGATYIYCYGDWKVTTIEKVEKSIFTLQIDTKKVYIDFSNIDKLDSSGALLLYVLKDNLVSKNIDVEFINLNPRFEALFKIIQKSFSKTKVKPRKKRNFIENIGIKFINVYNYLTGFIAFIGELFIKSIYIFKNIRNFRIAETVYFIQTSGINAMGIIAMTSFLVGVVIAYQTIVQLSKFGADIFVVDASSIAIARELGPMITAIVVAGRSASSYTAEIGAMKLTQELDAMKTMGFMPFYFLIIPRVIALMISLPILIFFSDIVGILGSMVATKAQIGLSFDIFINRLYEVLALKHYVVGIVKGPFFAIVIALIGSFHGLRVTQDTESIGIETTKSVVNAIFFVIVLDALFSVIFTELGI